MSEEARTDDVPDVRHGLVHSAVDAFADSTRTLVELLAAAGGSTIAHLPVPVPDAVGGLLSAMRRLVDQMPPVTEEIDVLVQEVHAKRLSVQALQAELAALDGQLAVLEKSL
jgi:hypothetical protein